MSTRMIKLDEIRIDGGTQARCQIDQHTIDNYLEFIDELPPIVVFIDGASNWLADGFHRYHTFRKANRNEIPCTCRSGTLREAILYSVRANTTHGLPRSTEDKIKSITTLLADPEWKLWTDAKIAEECRVGPAMVAKHRANYAPRIVGPASGSKNAVPDAVPEKLKERWADIESEGGTPRITEKAGKVSVMDVSKIGRKKSDDEPSSPEELDEIQKAVEESEKEPFTDFCTEMDEVISLYRSAHAKLIKVIGYDAQNKNITNKWARDYSRDGTVGASSALIRALGDGMPVEMSAKDPKGYITKRRASIDKQLKVA